MLEHQVGMIYVFSDAVGASGQCLAPNIKPYGGVELHVAMMHEPSKSRNILNELSPQLASGKSVIA